MHDIDVKALTSHLPAAPLEALLLLTQRLRKEAADNDYDDSDYEIACIIVRKFAKATATLDGELSFGDENTWKEEFERIEIIVQQTSREITIGQQLDQILDDYQNPDERFGYAHLSTEEKAHIRTKLSTIKKAIDASDLSPRKKNAIRKRIADLEREVDMDGTRIDNAMALLVDLSLAIGNAHKNLKPLIEDAKDVANIVLGRRAKDEQSSLPKPDADDILGLPKPSDTDGGRK
jgi:hypothetical protein